MLEIRDRIDRKIMEQIHPKDLFYQILDGLRSLTHYDHSSALLIRENGEDTLRVVAEQISWTKARSHRIGLTLPLDVGPPADAGFGRDPWLRSPRRYLERVDREAGRASGRDARLQPRRACGRRRGTRSVDALCAARRARRHVRDSQGGRAASGTAEAIRCRARRSFPVSGGDCHPEPASHRIVAGSHPDGRAQSTPSPTSPEPCRTT